MNKMTRLIAFCLITLATGPARCSDQAIGKEAIGQLVGAWRLIGLERPAPGGHVQRVECTGLFVFTPDGHASVQVMERFPNLQSNAASPSYAAAGSIGRQMAGGLNTDQPINACFSLLTLHTLPLLSTN